jgi:uncharacterized DUF497 family protein
LRGEDEQGGVLHANFSNEVQNVKNIAERGLSLERVADLDWDTAVIIVDTRRDYGEPRRRVMARLDGVLHAAVVTPRRGSAGHQLPQGQQM